MTKSMLLVGLILVLMALAPLSMAAEEKRPLNFKVKDIDGKEVDLSQYQGKVVMVVNVASKCGNTPQYKSLEAAHKKYGEKGLVILGFPANEFGKQEPGTDAEIKAFCTSKYNVDFPMFSKVVVKGEGTVPLYQALTSTPTTYVPVKGENQSGMTGPVSWNFEKFLIGRDGKVVARFAPKVAPDDPRVVEKIEAELAKK